MISRIGWFANCGLAACLLLVGAGWLNGQQQERRTTRGYHSPSATYGSLDCEEGIEQAGFRNEPAVGARYQSQAETGQFRPQAENGTRLHGRSSAVIGASVRLGDGNRVGRIEDIMIGESGCVDYMIVTFDGMSGLGGRLAAVPWSAGRMDFAARTVTLDIERERLYAAPIFFTRGRWPDLYESQWAASVHAHFGTKAEGDRSIQRAYPTPAPNGTDVRQDEKGARPRPPKDDSRGLSPTPAPGRTTQPRDAERKDREGVSTPPPAPRPADEPSSRKKDADKTGELPDEKANGKEKQPTNKPENNNDQPE